MTAPAISPEKIMHLTGGVQSVALLGVAVDHEVFTRLERGAMTVDELATAASIAPRGAKALLDGLTGLGLVTVAGGKYGNSPEASTFLVEGKPTALTGMVRVSVHNIGEWAKFPTAVKTGAPVTSELLEAKDLPFWHLLVPAIAPLQVPAAQAVVARLDIARRGPLSILDVGGGSGIYSAILLGANREARSTQVDWPTVNAIAKGFVAKFGVAERFHTVDGDFHTADWGTGHDVAIFSNIAHQESPAQNGWTGNCSRSASTRPPPGWRNSPSRRRHRLSPSTCCRWMAFRCWIRHSASAVRHSRSCLRLRGRRCT